MKNAILILALVALAFLSGNAITEVPQMINYGRLLIDGGGFNVGPPLCPPVYTFTGEASGDIFSFPVSNAGDVNGDGVPDLIIGAFQNDAGGFNAGRAYVFSGQTGETIYVFTGEAAGDQFGLQAYGAGDVNNDGFADLIVGASGNDGGGIDAGRAYVFSGQTGGELYIFTGEAAGDMLGINVAAAGDVDLDGFDDLIVAASANDGGGTDAGRVYVFSGQTGDTIYIFTGEAAGDRFGYGVSSAGDVNDDGIPDVTVGADQNDAAGNDAGRAYVFFGGDGPFPISVAAADADYIFTGEAAGDHFGWNAMSAGDVNNDGFDDLLVSARWNDAGGNNAGRAYIYSGQTEDMLCIFTGEAAGDLLGYCCGSAGDVDSDGFDDVIIGAPYNDAGGTDAGRAYIYSGQTFDTLYVFTGGPGSTRLGGGVGSAGDINGAGFDDVIIGAYGFASAKGRAYVYLLDDTDGDGVGDVCDNCPDDENTNQADSDGDGNGDVCDLCPGYDDKLDADGDNVPDDCDICPGHDDNIDTDGDTVPDGCDICPGHDDNVDIDGDTVPDGCDICPGYDDYADSDGDTVPDSCDNCPDVSNPGQVDSNGNGIGDVCEYVCGDANGDGEVNVGDAVFLINYVFKGGPAPDPVCVGDANGDDDTNVGDAVYLINYVFKGGPPPVQDCCP